MAVFEDFEREYGPPGDCQAIADSASENYIGRLPDQLLDLWRKYGWCSWGNGLLWTLDPAQLSDVLEDWPQPAVQGGLVFLRTAFAHLYFWKKDWVYSLDVHHNSLSQVTTDISLMFGLLCDPQMKDKILRVPLFESAVKRLGRPERDECFTFQPALSLGGSDELPAVQKVQVREELGILAQFAR